MTAPKVLIETFPHHRAAGIAAAEDYLERKAEERPLRIFKMLIAGVIVAAMGWIGATIVLKGWANVEHEISYARKG
jgi:hypothetical protein